MNNFIITSTNSVDNYEVKEYLGVVNVNFVAGTDFINDFFASMSDFFGGTSGTYKSEMDRLYGRAKCAIETEAINKGANAILGYKIDFDEISGKGKSMFMISVSGTAVILVEKHAVNNRYEIYKKLYDLYLFKECGIISEEQYKTEKDNILYLHEENIKSEIEKVKDYNEIQEYKIKQIENQKIKLKEQEELIIRQKEEEERRRQKVADEIEKIRANQDTVKKIQNDFLQNSTIKYNEIKTILNANIQNPINVLNTLTLADIKNAKYDITNITLTDKMSYIIGWFIKNNKIVEACKYYIDIIKEDDIIASKTYVQSIYEMITFSKQDAFEKIAMNLIELKYLDKKEEAIIEFMKYAVCERDVAEQVINIL